MIGLGSMGLNDRRFRRIRAASAAGLAAELAAKSGERQLEEESRRLVAQCQDVLKKL